MKISKYSFFKVIDVRGAIKKSIIYKQIYDSSKKIADCANTRA